ncbi:hypothetical protein V2J09_005684 [Rumex salicifolius]
MEGAELITRFYELRLLRCSVLFSSPSDAGIPPLASPSCSPGKSRIHLLIDSVLTSIESGCYVEALSSEAAQLAFQRLPGYLFAGGSVEAGEFYAELESAVETFLAENGVDGAVLIISIAVASLLAFVQCNMTGPVIELPSVPLPWKVITKGASWEAWARNEIMSAGSDLIGKFSSLQFIVFAKMLLTKAKDVLFKENSPNLGELRSISWWIFRTLHLQQRILDDRCSSLLDLLQVYGCESLDHFGAVEKVTSYWGGLLNSGEALTIVSLLYLEAGLMEHTFGRVDSARDHFKSAELAFGFEISVTGALGFRTIHQVEPKALMVLRANGNPLSSGIASSNLQSSSEEASTAEEGSEQNGSERSEISDILMTPRLVDNGETDMTDAGDTLNCTVEDMGLHAIKQLVVLAQCLLIEKSARQDEIQRWKMAPYIEAVDSQQSSYFIIKCFCNILRIRWESSRSRTKERSLLMMDKLVQGLLVSHPEVQERIHYCFGVYIPTVPALRKEYGELLVSLGMIGEALNIFEDLELWDNLIYCYRLLEKKAAAVELIKQRLSETPNDSRCSMGDVTNDDAYFRRALEVSNDRCARAKRSLARSAYNRGEYETAKLLWESAMALNSLYPDGWFALGAAALKAKDVDKALDGFTRAVQLDPDNGEAWNNVACLHMMKKRNKEAFIAFKEALKFKRKSWQMWENYSCVAADVGNFAQAMEAMQKVFDLSGCKRIDIDLLTRVVGEMESRVVIHSQSHDDDCNNIIKETKSEVAVPRETEHLIELLGKLLQQMVKSNAVGDIWGLYARWHRIKGDLSMCSEAFLKQVRSYQGADLWKDIDRFKKFAIASLELCRVYMEISTSTGSLRELRAAEMHLRNTIKQASAFSDTQEFKNLETCLDEMIAGLPCQLRPHCIKNDLDELSEFEIRRAANANLKIDAGRAMRKNMERRKRIMVGGEGEASTKFHDFSRFTDSAGSL